MKENTTINACLTQTGIAPKTTTEVVFNFNQKEKIMNNLRNFLVGLVGLLFVVQLALVSPVSAQSPKQIERERISQRRAEALVTLGHFLIVPMQIKLPDDLNRRMTTTAKPTKRQLTKNFVN